MVSEHCSAPQLSMMVRDNSVARSHTFCDQATSEVWHCFRLSARSQRVESGIIDLIESISCDMRTVIYRVVPIDTFRLQTDGITSISIEY